MAGSFADHICVAPESEAQLQKIANCRRLSSARYRAVDLASELHVEPGCFLVEVRAGCRRADASDGEQGGLSVDTVLRIDQQ